MWRQLTKMAKKEITLCVDVDGTLLSYDGYERDVFGDPREDVVDKIRELKDKGVEIVLYTARDDAERDALVQRLKTFDIYDLFDEIVCGKKPIAFAYLDDKAVNCLDDGWESKIDKMYEENSKE